MGLLAIRALAPHCEDCSICGSLELPCSWTLHLGVCRWRPWLMESNILQSHALSKQFFAMSPCLPAKTPTALELHASSLAVTDDAPWQDYTVLRGTVWAELARIGFQDVFHIFLANIYIYIYIYRVKVSDMKCRCCIRMVGGLWVAVQVELRVAGMENENQMERTWKMESWVIGWVLRPPSNSLC